MKSALFIIGLLAVTATGLTACSPTGDAGAGTTSFWLPVLFLVFIFAMLYFISIRPQRRRQKEHDNLLGDLATGDHVVTAGGMFGKVESLDADSVVLKVESGATIRFAKSSIVGRRGQ